MSAAGIEKRQVDGLRITDESTLARMWESAEALPSLPELEEPTLWLARIT